MAIKVTFSDGSVVEYPEGVVVADNQDGTLKFVNDASGNALAMIPKSDLVSWERS